MGLPPGPLEAKPKVQVVPKQPEAVPKLAVPEQTTAAVPKHPPVEVAEAQGRATSTRERSSAVCWANRQTLLG